MSQPFAILLAEQAVRQFFKQWNAGLQPCLLLETRASGAIFVSSNVTAGVTLPEQTEYVFQPPPQARHHPRQHSRPPGPSRLRRRERRAQARELAAAQAVAKTQNNSEAAVQVVASPPARCDAAVQAVTSSRARAVASAEPAPALTPHHHKPAVQADPPHGGPDSPLQVLLRQMQGEQYVMDTFCPDRDYNALQKKRRDEDERRKERQAALEEIRRMIEGD